MRGRIRGKCPVLGGILTTPWSMLAVIEASLMRIRYMDDSQVQTATSISCSLRDGLPHSLGDFTGPTLVFQARQTGNDLMNANVHRSMFLRPD